MKQERIRVKIKNPAISDRGFFLKGTKKYKIFVTY
jgi:hypothetical protein